MNSVISNNMSAISEACKKYKVKELYAFGSVTDENKFNEKSDIDLLVEFGEASLADYADNYSSFVETMEKLFGREVDLVTAKYLRNRFFIQRVNETKQKLFQA
ncbi:MAG: nucleotidyltransferase domain-containing protein [Bacteroidetes bacterium]|nr:nucleotidyltransferase domain-containing protein [Bacteroidota bacterium]